MSLKTLAVLVDPESNRYRVTKWQSTGSHLPSRPRHPAKLYERSQGNGWELLESWPASDGKTHSTTLKSDKEVLKEALERLEISFGVDISTIVYDKYSGPELDGFENKTVGDAL